MDTFGQNDKEEIQKTFEQYFETVEQKDNAKTLEYIYPKLFESYPKERMLEAMDRMKAETSTIIEVTNGQISSISETFIVDGVKYALIKYSFHLRMSVLNTEEKTGPDAEHDQIEFDDTDEESQVDQEPEASPGDLMYEMLKGKYGAMNVAYDQENSRFSIKASNEMYSIYDPVYKSWKFLEKKESMKPLLSKLLPKRVLTKF